MRAYTIEGTGPSGRPVGKNLIIWQQGRMIFTISVLGERAASEALFVDFPQRAARAASQFATLTPPPPSFGPRPAYMPSEPKMLELLFALHQRMLPDNALEGLERDVETTTNLPALMHETS